MRTRRDGEETRRRILETALGVFGEKGYHDATHADICRLAGVNTAAINYHFGSKDGLYRATWGHAIAQVDRRHPVDGGVAPDSPAAQRLQGTVTALLRRFTDKRLGYLHSIRLMEHANPTGVLDEVVARRIRLFRAHLSGILRDLLGPDANDDDVQLCEMSVASQCHAVRCGRHAKRRRSPPPWRFTAADVDRLAEHITRFSLAGVEAVRREVRDRASRP